MVTVWSANTLAPGNNEAAGALEPTELFVSRAASSAGREGQPAGLLRGAKDAIAQAEPAQARKVTTGDADHGCCRLGFWQVQHREPP
jgi:hypothetical protein